MTECHCDYCKNSCGPMGHPGRFLPGEAEKVAAFKGLTLQELFTKYLGVEYDRDSSADDLFLLAPATVDMKPGHEYPGYPRGQCVFFKDGGCEIHAVKPYECREASHHDTLDICRQRDRVLFSRWSEMSAQVQVRQLLGRPPIKAELTELDWLRLQLYFLGIPTTVSGEPPYDYR